MASQLKLTNAQIVTIEPDAQTSGDATLGIPDLAGVAKKIAALTPAELAVLATLLGASANGKSLVTAADYAAMRTLLGLVIGTNVQAYDADIAALAGLNSAADKLPYFTGAGAAALATFTAAGRALMDDADAAAQRATLGVSPSPIAALVAFVETTGDNATAVMGDPGKPYLTMQAAYDAGAKVFYLGGGTHAGITTTGAIKINVLGRGRDGFGTSTKTTVTTIKSTDGGAVTVGDLGHFSVLFTTIESTFAATGGSVTLRGCYATTVRALAKGGAGSVTMTHSRASTIHCYGAEAGQSGGSATLLYSQATTVNLYGDNGSLSSDSGTPGGNGGNGGILVAQNSIVTSVNAYGGDGGENDATGTGGDGGNGGSVTLLFTPFLTAVTTSGGSGGIGVDYGGTDGSPGADAEYVQQPVQNGVRSLAANQNVVSTVGTTETQIALAALAANTIEDFDGVVEAVFAGTFASGGGTTRRLRVLLDGTELYDSAAMIHTGAGSWELRVRFQCFVSSTQYTATLIANGVTVTVPIKVAQTSAYAYNSAADLELLGTSGAGGVNGDITLLQSSVSRLPAIA